MKKLSGTHGTTIARTEKISREGFKGRIGRRGTGVYFWCDSYHAKDLAESWWRYSNDRGRYIGDNNTNFALIIGFFEVNDDEYLNIETHELKNQIAIIIANKKIPNRLEYLAATYDLFINRLEAQNNQKYQIIEMRVSPPQMKYCEYYPILILGDPYCYLVRDTDCIKKLQIEV